jgi:hypothetical protein
MLDHYDMESIALVQWESNRFYRCHVGLMACRRYLLGIDPMFSEASRVLNPSGDCCMGHEYYVGAHRSLDDPVDTEGIALPCLYRCRMSRVDPAEHNRRAGRPLSNSIVQAYLRLWTSSHSGYHEHGSLTHRSRSPSTTRIRAK